MATTPPPRPIQIRPDIWVDCRRALWLARPRLLVVADLHWGYAASHRVQGNLLPMWGDDEIALRLRGLISDFDPAAVIWLGDSLHALAGRRVAEQFLDGPACPPTTVLPGNHDLRWDRVGAASLQRDGYCFHHGDAHQPVPADCIEVVGHYHPAVVWNDGAGGRLKLPALVEGPRRLILPAFSPWAAGTPWNNLCLAEESLWAIAPRRIFKVPVVPS